MCVHTSTLEKAEIKDLPGEEERWRHRHFHLHRQDDGRTGGVAGFDADEGGVISHRSPKVVGAADGLRFIRSNFLKTRRGKKVR